jgi:hypothetical protein
MPRFTGLGSRVNLDLMDTQSEAPATRFAFSSSGGTRVALILTLAASALLSACDFSAGDLESDFQDAILTGWVAEGVQFLGKYGSGPIVAVESTGDEVWTVTYPEPTIGEIQAEFKITAMAAYRIFPTDDFARFLNEEAIGRDRRSGLVREAWTLVSGGSYQAIGRMSMEVRRANASGLEKITVYALLPVVAEGLDARWEVRGETRSLVNLFGAMQGMYETMLRSDDQVMDCAADTDPTSNRPLFMSCAEEILAIDFDPMVTDGS